MSTEKNELQTTAKNEVQTPDGVERIAQKRVYVPRVDIYEEEKEVVILADMPGVKAEDVEINLEKDILSLTGHLPITADSKPEYAEYGVGDYERHFTISRDIDREKIGAEMKNGVLTITLPKHPQATAHTIPVKASA